MAEEIGSLAEEAQKLYEALVSNSEYAAHASTCTWCPVCRFVNLVRDNPETITTTMLAMIGAAQQFLSTMNTKNTE